MSPITDAKRACFAYIEGRGMVEVGQPVGVAMPVGNVSVGRPGTPEQSCLEASMMLWAIQMLSLVGSAVTKQLIQVWASEKTVLLQTQSRVVQAWGNIL